LFPTTIHVFYYIVTIASTESGVHPVGKVKRWCGNKRVDVDQPHCYLLYNKYMGGVDRLDQNVGKYRIAIRLKRWYWQMMMFPINVCANNAFQLYRLSPAGQAKDAHDFLSFTRYIVQTYLILGKSSTSIPKRIGGKTPATTKSKLPDSVRLDGKDHYIIRNETQIRCRECHKNTKFKCKSSQDPYANDGEYGSDQCYVPSDEDNCSSSDSETVVRVHQPNKSRRRVGGSSDSSKSSTDLSDVPDQNLSQSEHQTEQESQQNENVQPSTSRTEI
ncbi:PiggyBac transposable element-derived protein 3, partial [Danaus plexippus plexippus]